MRLEAWWMPALAAVLWLGACGNEHAPQRSLQQPAQALADRGRCDEASVRDIDVGPVGHRWVDGQCMRTLRSLELQETALGERKRALEAVPSRLVTADELFDWAERTYPQFFPSSRTTRKLSPYQYRYYPETDNHAAVATDGKVYVQGPISGGDLLFVGTLQEFTCRVMPSLCGQTPGASCTPIAEWTVNGNVCTPNPGQSPRIADGVLYSFIDSIGATTGVATFRCNNGTLVPTVPATCQTATALPCDTSALSWTVGGVQCTPNSNEPRSIVSDSSYTFTDSTGTNGRATFSCSNGTLSGPTGATCAPPPPMNCQPPANLSWTAGGETCTADSIDVTSVADNAALFVVDSVGNYTGSATFRCAAGTLLPEGDQICALGARMKDSFGGDGGSADGDAAGDGTAADGAPIVGATVRITDINGRQATALTDNRGYWRTRLTGMTPPLLIVVTRPDGRTRRSISVQPLRVNAYTFMAVTGLTDKIVSDLAVAAGFFSPAALTPTMVSQLGSAVVAQKISALRNHPVVREQLLQAGLNPDTFDPLNTPFRADGTGYDRVLDSVAIVTNADGTIAILRPSDISPTVCAVGTVSWTVGSVTCSVSNLAVVLASGATITFSDDIGPTYGSATFSCVNGVLVGPSYASCNFD